MLMLLRQRNFGLLWFGGLISQIGNWALITVLPFYIYEQTGSTLAAGSLWIAYTLPGLLFGSVAGVFVDRWDRKRTMVVVSLLQALLLLLLVRSNDWLWLIYLVAFLESSLGQFFYPAENALLPRLVGEEHVLTANSLNSLNDNLARVIGPSIGGALMGVFGLSAAVLVDSASFLIAGLLISLIAPPPMEKQRSPAEPSARWLDVWQEWRDGLQLVRRDPLLQSVFLVAGTALHADSILSTLLVPFVNAVAQGGAQALGIILSVRGAGGLIGGVVIGRIGNSMRPGRLLAWSLIAIGALFMVEVNIPRIPLILALTLLLGVPVIGWLSSQQTLLQTGTTDEFRGRVFGAFGTTNALMLLIGTVLAGVGGDIIGVVPLLNVSASLYMLAGVLAWLRLRHVERPSTAEPVPA